MDIVCLAGSVQQAQLSTQHDQMIWLKV